MRGRHPYWGPSLATLTGYADDKTLRYAGASGGAISALAAHALQTGRVQRVLHIEADPDQPTGNRLRWSETVDDILAGAGSRYAPSAPLAFIDQALADGRPFVFIGKPCDVSALRQLAKHDPRVDLLVPLMLSFYCGGLPSRHGADRLVQAMDVAPQDLVQFRYRGNGWPGLTVATTQQGEQKSMRYADSWGRHLSREVQFRCKICPDAVGAVADISCADAWYGDEEGYPSFDEQEGRSLIQVRTDRGAGFLHAALSSGVLNTASLSVDDIALMQPSQANRKRLISSRIAACRMLLRPVPVMEGLDVGRAARLAPLGLKLRNFLGTVSRLIKARH
jgi:coenzyme F420 hydrogenase subunit beta